MFFKLKIFHLLNVPFFNKGPYCKYSIYYLAFHRLLFIFWLLPQLIYSQSTSTRLTIDLQGLQYDSLWFGPYSGRTAPKNYLATRSDDSLFTFSIDNKLQEGLYAFVVKKSSGARPEYFPFWITDSERNFTIETNMHSFYSKATIVGSAENMAYFHYQHQYELVAKNLATVIENFRLLPDAASWRSLMLAEKTLHLFQKTFLQKYPATKTAELVAKTMLLLPPAGYLPDDWTKAALLHFQWQKAHFFNQMDLSSQDLLHYSFYLDKLDHYLLMLPPPDPDTVINMIDSLFVKLEGNPEMYQYYLQYLTQVTETISRHRTDEVFIHLVRQYTEKGKLNRVSAEQLERWRLSAERLSRITAGNLAPNLTVKKESGEEVTLHGIETEWLLVVFWLPDCAHCKRELPEIKKLSEKYKEQGLKVLSICGKSGTQAPDCWKFSREESLPKEWLLTNDPERQSRFASLYNVRAYPNIVLMDKDKRIRYKQAGAAPPFTLDRVLSCELGNGGE